uniref:Uncharacterized protein n=1 Tax=Romanomermis culicivorax TaxID=13658 RepID=A0A915ILJ3_ROMCU
MATAKELFTDNDRMIETLIYWHVSIEGRNWQRIILIHLIILERNVFDDLYSDSIRIIDYHHDSLDDLGFEMSQKDDEIQRLNAKIDKMADSMIGVQGLLERFILDQKERDIQ